jgi:hypothetical protein
MLLTREAIGYRVKCDTVDTRSDRILRYYVKCSPSEYERCSHGPIVSRIESRLNKLLKNKQSIQHPESSGILLNPQIHSSGCCMLCLFVSSLFSLDSIRETMGPCEQRSYSEGEHFT